MSSMRRNVSTYRTVDGVADPSPDVGKWRRSLRNLDPEARKQLSYSGDLFKSRSFSQSNQKPGDDLDAAASLEKEYIMSLQQHLYLLELENIHLRSQSTKSVSMQAPMSADAERMLTELKSLEAKIDALQLENFRKDNSVEQLQQRILYLTARLTGQEDARQGDRRAQAQGADALELERDALQQRVGQLRARVAQLEAGQLDGGLETAEGRVRQLRDQLEAALDKLARADTSLSEERDAVSRLSGEVRRLEQELAGSDRRSQEATLRQLREENQRLRRQVDAAAQPDELAALAKRNAALESAVQRLQTELRTAGAKERSGGDEATRLREREWQLEQQAARNAREASELRRRLEQLEGAGGGGGVADLARQCQTLQRDNAQLAQHVRGLEAALERKQAEKAAARAAMEGSEARLSEMQTELSKLQQLQATRWSEVEKIASTIRTAAKSNSDLFDRH